MKYTVNIEKREDGSFIAYNIGGEAAYIGTGSTVSEAKEDFFNTLQETRDFNKDNGFQDDDILKGVPVFKFDLASLFEYYNFFNVTALAKIIGISSSLMRQYKSGNTSISEKQLSKIETGIHRLGNELATLRLI